MAVHIVSSSIVKIVGKVTNFASVHTFDVTTIKLPPPFMSAFAVVVYVVVAYVVVVYVVVVYVVVAAVVAVVVSRSSSGIYVVYNL